MVKDAGTTSAAQRELKTTLFRKAGASKPAIYRPLIIKHGGNYKEWVKEKILLDFGGKINEAEKCQKENPRSAR